MRAPGPILLFLFACTALAQLDEKPPVIRRAPSSPVDQPATSSGKSSKKEPDTLTAEGIVRHMDSKMMDVAIDDGRIFKAAIDSKTVFLGPAGKVDPATIDAGTRVRISVKHNDDMDLTATSVVVEKPTTDAAKPETILKPEEDAATQQREDTDAGRPVLKRGVPKKVAHADADAEKEEDDPKEDDPQPVVAAVKTGAAQASPAADPDAKSDSLASALSAENQPALLKKAFDANREFVAHLPNFVCQQYTTRYERENKIEGWKAKDIISATVVYQDRKEHYDNIKINNRAANADMMSIKGARSIGEFGSVLEGLFAREVNAEFRYLHAESLHQVHAKVFAYSVKRETTDWTIAMGGQSIEPAYSGRLWLDADTGRVLRIERQADNIPESFPLSLVEQTVDYDAVMLGGRKVLLPVESSNLSCQRGSPFCSKNVLQFRDYKEFRGDATVSFDK